MGRRSSPALPLAAPSPSGTPPTTSLNSSRCGSPTLRGAWSLALLAAEGAGTCGRRDGAGAVCVHVEAAIEHGAVMRQLAGRLIETIAGQVAACAGQLSAAKRRFETALLQA